MWRKIRIFL